MLNKMMGYSRRLSVPTWVNTCNRADTSLTASFNAGPSSAQAACQSDTICEVDGQCTLNLKYLLVGVEMAFTPYHRRYVYGLSFAG